MKFYPNIQNSSVTVCLSLRGKADLSLKASYGGNPCGTIEIPSAFGYVAAEIKLSEKHLWEIGQGNLYDLSLIFGDDEVKSYFALREVTFDDGFLFINGEKIFMRLVLDQGFYEEGVYTAPTDKDLENDILNSLKCGFNGARLHEKVFEERFLYYADKHGYIVWGEYPDWGLGHSDPVNIYSILPEWTEEINRDFNHPAIIGWCPHNETWDQYGKKQYDPAIKLLYDMTKALDPTRPCIDTSGNYHVVTDLYDLHDYSSDPAKLASHYADLNNMSHHSAFKNRQTYRGGAVFISEYGGIGWNVGDGWGYGNGPKTEEEFYSRLEALTSALVENPNVSGFCYTQLTDVEQERNGLFTFSRAPKFDLPRLKKIFSQPRPKSKIRYGYLSRFDPAKELKHPDTETGPDFVPTDKLFDASAVDLLKNSDSTPDAVLEALYNFIKSDFASASAFETSNDSRDVPTIPETAENIETDDCFEYFDPYYGYGESDEFEQGDDLER